MFGLGMGELMVIFLIALIFIGPKKLPELAKGLGKGLREFQNATKGFSEQLDQAKREITDAAREEEVHKVPDAIPVENATAHSHSESDASKKPEA
jgi:TatA/E family protein of Tat protein translocase